VADQGALVKSEDVFIHILFFENLNQIFFLAKYF